MTLWTIIETATGNVIRPVVYLEDGQTFEFVGCAPEAGQQAIPIPFAPDPARHKWVNGAWVEDPALVEVSTLRAVELGAEDASREQLYRRIAITQAWQEVTLLKMHQSLNLLVALSDTEKRKRFPTIMALVIQSGATIAQVSTQVENRYWATVRDNAWVDAKLALSKDAVKNAATAQAKKDVLAGINWIE